MARVVVLVALLVLLAAPGSPAPLAFALNGQGDSGHHIVDPVDYLTWCGDCVGTDYTTGSPWVVNPHDNWPYGLPLQGQQPGCSWDADDGWSYVATGNIIAAGATATVQECRYSSAGGYPELRMDIGIRSPSDELFVTVRWDWGSAPVIRTVAPIWAQADHSWTYFACLISPAPFDGVPVAIPNSHEGSAIPTLITVTVTNPTGQKIGKTGGFIEGGLINGLSRGCTTWT